MSDELTKHHANHVRDSPATLELVQVALIVQKQLADDVARARQVVPSNALPDRVNFVVVERLLEPAVRCEARALRRLLRIISMPINRPISRGRQTRNFRHSLRLQKAMRVLLEERRNVGVVVVVLDLIVEQRRGLSKA